MVIQVVVKHKTLLSSGIGHSGAHWSNLRARLLAFRVLITPIRSIIFFFFRITWEILYLMFVVLKFVLKFFTIRVVSLFIDIDRHSACLALLELNFLVKRPWTKVKCVILWCRISLLIKIFRKHIRLAYFICGLFNANFIYFVSSG